jgi:hypothetical protein
MKHRSKVGTVRSGNGGWLPVWIEIQYENERLSITGQIGKQSYGQICMDFDHLDKSQNDTRMSHPIKPNEINFFGAWNTSKWYKLLDIWHKWHLNDMRAGCEHQTAFGYDSKYLSEGCPICGYRYGSKWNFEPVPNDVVEFLQTV